MVCGYSPGPFETHTTTNVHTLAGERRAITLPAAEGWTLNCIFWKQSEARMHLRRYVLDSTVERPIMSVRLLNVGVPVHVYLLCKTRVKERGYVTSSTLQMAELSKESES